MKTNLSHILPVWKACQILGEPTVTRIVVGLLNLLDKRNPSTSSSPSAAASASPRGPNDPRQQQGQGGGDAAAAAGQDDDDDDRRVERLVHGLFYRHPPPRYPDTALPPTVMKSWDEWLSSSRTGGSASSPSLALDKPALLRWLVPTVVQPHAGPSGHMGLFDCLVYALQNHGVGSNLSSGGANVGSPGGAGAAAAANSNVNTSAPWMIHVPDVLILLAICKQYQEERRKDRDGGAGGGAADMDSDHRPAAAGDDYDDDDSSPMDVDDDDEDELGGSHRSTSSRRSDGSAGLGGGGSHHSASSRRSAASADLEDQEEARRHRERIRREKNVWCMSLLAFRIYDSYQKKGVVARDTVHRFLTDVYGEDSYKEEATIALLDAVFDTAPPPPTLPEPGEEGSETATEEDGEDKGEGAVTATTAHQQDELVDHQQPAFARHLHATVAEGDFCRRILRALPDYSNAEFVLLDWMSTLASRFLPPPEMPDSVSAFLSALYTKPLPVCQMYGLPEYRLFEIKRRFHSLVKNSSPLVIQGDIMSNTEDVSAADVEASASPAHQRGTSASLPYDTGTSIPKQAISEAAFIDAMSKPNNELGSGGYLPKSLARLLFWNGGHRDVNFNAHSTATSSSANSVGSGSGAASAAAGNAPSSAGYWGLYHVLHFGCIAVRRNVAESSSKNHSSPTSGKNKQNRNVALLRFVFGMFQWTTALPSSNGAVAADDIDELDRTILKRSQVAHMIVKLLEFSEFRRLADSSPMEESDDEDGPCVLSSPDEDMEEWLVEEEVAELTGLAPSKIDEEDRVKSVAGRTESFIKLRPLVDAALEGVVTPNEMTFDEFCKWGDTVDKKHQQTRLATLLLELRVIASIQFGIPPTDASMELGIIGEVEARHKDRYPQSDVSRRGPRGTVWYLIDATWLKNWALVVKSQASKKGGHPELADTHKGNRGLDRISNTGLLAEDGSLALRPDIRWKYDYEILPPLAWSALQAWYDGGPPIYRSVVRYISSQATSPHSSVGNRPRIPTENELELYPFFVTVYLCDAASRGEARPFQQNYQLSRVSPVLVMLVQMCKELEVDPDLARLWVIENPPNSMSYSPTAASGKATGGGGDSLHRTSSSSSHSNAGTSAGSAPNSEDWILNLEQNIVEQRKQRGIPSDRSITLLLELKDKETNLWPRGLDGKEWSFKKESDHGGPSKQETDLGDGIVGLYNMGNTCYLNSPIQCLSHTPILREYFTSKCYLRDINKTNPLGHGGQLAQVSAVLINSLWKRFNQSNHHTPLKNRVKSPGSYALVPAPSLTPKTFKESIGKFNEHFQGNEQHDAHELLAFLLAGLSEDLNRVVDKPYLEAPDSDGRPDQELADIWWSNHLKREMSVIVALFTGQYKSLLTCRTCNYESARFEPFTCIQVPLPEDDYLPVSLFLYPVQDGVSTMKYCVRVRTDGRLRDVLIALAKVLHADEIEEETGMASPKSHSSRHSSADAAAEDDDTQSEAFYSRLAANLAVVDMRDGYISKIAPNSWSLQDLQNKETGELPLLHVYQLDPIPDDDDVSSPGKAMTGESKVENSEADTTDGSGYDETEKKPKRGFLAVSQRRSEIISQDLLHPFVHRVFGTPLLLRIDALEKRTGRELYDLIARRLRNFVPKAAQRFLLARNTRVISSSGDESHSGAELNETDHSAGTAKRIPGTNKTTTDMEEVSAGSVPRYGFRLRLTTRDGRRCLTCPWYDCCIGCFIPDDDAPTAVMDGDSLVVDWHFAVDLATSGFGTRSSQLEPIVSSQPQPRPKPYITPVRNHSSCGTSARRMGQAGVTTLEDCLDAFAKEERIPDAYCSKCKDFRVQMKMMSVWRLPPVLIIHLKRFQSTQHLRRKLRDLVVFPIEGLNLSRIMAADSQASRGDSGENGSLEEEDGNEGEASSPSSLKDNKGRDEMLYDLYGVVHHQGALSGGHYVASLKSEEDGQWRLFNDAQIYEIHARDVVDASAYILFYIRRDAAKARLSDYWDVSGEGGVSEEDMEKLIKKGSDRCVIS